ncbi:hypothetical protein QUB08_25300 [Microcoleus sp. BR0-C5]|uniref:hypothetical protein n=1 Tax=Microcoleus sp. BR0-C5 TaxID=2818713 RepID=UPI002FD527A8
MLVLTRNDVRRASAEVDLAYENIPNTTYLLPPRAIAKMALVLPAASVVQAVLRSLNDEFPMIEAATLKLPHNDIVRGTRISSAQISRYTAQAKIVGKYAYIQHFGDKVSHQTWERLLNYQGAFPPPCGIGVVKVDDSF